MPAPIPIDLVVEDLLSESVVRRLLDDEGTAYAVGTCYRPGGYGYIKKRIGAFNQAAQYRPFLVLTDLDADKAGCAPDLIRLWLSEAPHPNLIFRVAVREVESWLLADADGFSRFLGIRARVLPGDPDAVPDPKQALISLAERSARRQLRDSIVPRRGSTATQGPDYNGCLGDFVRNLWNPDAAAQRSASLRRFRTAVHSSRPRWP